MLRRQATPEGGDTGVAQGVEPLWSRARYRRKPRRGGTTTHNVSNLSNGDKTQAILTILTVTCAVCDALRGLRLIMHPTHRAYALGYICTTPFGGYVGSA